MKSVISFCKVSDMKPNIPIPCSEDWNKMKIGQFARHCGVCDKSVVDFTQKSRHEILSYLIEHRNEEVCGHVRLSQLDFRHEDTLIVIRDLEKKHRNTNLSYYLLSMATLSLLSCESEAKLPPAKPKIEQSKNLGKIKVDDSCQNPKKKDQLENNKIERKEKIGKEIEMIEGTVDGGMMIEEPKIAGGMEMIYDVPEPVVKGEFAINQKPRMIAEKMPEFPGGTDELINYIQRNLNYPKWEKRQKIQGTVYATFVVNEKGEITDPSILKSVIGSKNFDKEVIDLLNKMPIWKAGEDHGQKVSVQFNLPFKFKL
jgi:TonB family protein